MAKQLDRYVDTELHKGYKKGVIRKKLKKSGYDILDIEQSFDHIRKQHLHHHILLAASIVIMVFGVFVIQSVTDRPSPLNDPVLEQSYQNYIVTYSDGGWEKEGIVLSTTQECAWSDEYATPLDGSYDWVSGSTKVNPADELCGTNNPGVDKTCWTCNSFTDCDGKLWGYATSESGSATMGGMKQDSNGNPSWFTQTFEAPTSYDSLSCSVQVYTTDFGGGTYANERVNIKMNGRTVGTTTDWACDDSTCQDCDIYSDIFYNVEINPGTNDITFEFTGGSVSVWKYALYCNGITQESNCDKNLIIPDLLYDTTDPWCGFTESNCDPCSDCPGGTGCWTNDHKFMRLRVDNSLGTFDTKLHFYGYLTGPSQEGEDLLVMLNSRSDEWYDPNTADWTGWKWIDFSTTFTMNGGTNFVDITHPYYEDECSDGDLWDDDYPGYSINFGYFRYDCPQTIGEPECGNGLQESGEACDQGNDNGIVCIPDYESSCNYCTSSCTESTQNGEYCGDGSLQSTYEECDDGNTVNGDGCSERCLQEMPDYCVGADQIMNVSLVVLGLDCHNNCCTQDSETVTITTADYYDVRGVVNRGNPDQCQTNEDFSLEINGLQGPETEDDSDPCAISTREDFLGTFRLEQGSNTVFMHTAAQCPPDTGANSVDLVKLCFYGGAIPPPDTDCGTIGDQTNCELNECTWCEDCQNGQQATGEFSQSRCVNNTGLCEYSCVVGSCGATCDNPQAFTDNGYVCSYGCGIDTCTYSNSDSNRVCSDSSCTAAGWDNTLCTSLTCGNGVREGSEECDDGNTASGDGCSNTCTLENPFLCGNGQLEAGEQCDDGNKINNDGCNQYCQLENPMLCGNNQLDPGETCDDGNTQNGDDCNQYCQTETMYSECGNSILEEGEECDDGNNLNGDGCSNTCTLESPHLCGNNQLDPGETCDDGNTIPGDGCNQHCQTESSDLCGNNQKDHGEQCDTGLNDQDCVQSTSVCDEDNTRYGTRDTFGDCNTCSCNQDNWIWDYNTNQNDPYCMECDHCIDQVRNCGEFFTDRGGPCTAMCGNNKLEQGEICEGTTNSDDCSNPGLTHCDYATYRYGTRDTYGDCVDCLSCQTDLFTYGDPHNNDYCSNCQHCSDKIKNCGESSVDRGNVCGSQCGNGVLEGTEDCDDGNKLNEDGCSSTCTLENPTLCGNNQLNPGETCDDGNKLNEDGCDQHCQTEPSSSTCGNNILETGEQCDDGNTQNGDGCSSTCTLENPTLCGNNQLNPGETCDDGNKLNEDGCDQHCQTEPSSSTCGNNILETGEQCDDGNTQNNDGCDQNCQLEGNENCGNNQLDPGETCDDGNTQNNDGCSSTCTLENPTLCGDNYINPGEQCDDGNTAAADGCNEHCQLENPYLCGNNILNKGETCDDGNTQNNDGCNQYCQTELNQPNCGNNILETGEDCDDGNQQDHDGCTSTCTLENPTLCGNNQLNPGETCDDGNKLNEDGCDQHCQTEPSSSTCGNNILETGEQCDDGNKLNEDGCSSTCTIETPAVCGNTKLEYGEVCEGAQDSEQCTNPITSSCDYTTKQFGSADDFGDCTNNCQQCIPDDLFYGGVEDVQYCTNCLHCGDGSTNCGEQCDYDTYTSANEDICSYGCLASSTCRYTKTDSDKACQDSICTQSGWDNSPCCNLYSVSISPECGSDGCQVGDTLKITADYNVEGCHDTVYLHITANGNGCSVGGEQSDDITGIYSTCYQGLCSDWTFPGIPANCYGQNIYAHQAILSAHNFPDAPGGEILDMIPASGSFHLASGCPLGTDLCDDGTCKEDCGTDKKDCLINNGICDPGESCNCDDCQQEDQGPCAPGLMCDPTTGDPSLCSEKKVRTCESGTFSEFIIHRQSSWESIRSEYGTDWGPYLESHNVDPTSPFSSGLLSSICKYCIYDEGVVVNPDDVAEWDDVYDNGVYYACPPDPNDSAYCYDQDDCVYVGVCLPDDYMSDIDGDNVREVCDDDTWKEVSEDCTNGRDDDRDGRTDSEDSDCDAIIRGKVWSYDGIPLGSAEVIVLNSKEQVMAYSDNTGRYATNVKGDTLNQLTIGYEGYVPETKYGIYVYPKSLVTVDFSLIPEGSDCRPDCTLQDVCEASCDGFGGCHFPDDITKNACAGEGASRAPGHIIQWNSTHTIECCNSYNSMTRENRKRVEVDVDANQILTTRRIMLYNGEIVNMVVVVYK